MLKIVILTIVALLKKSVFNYSYCKACGIDINNVDIFKKNRILHSYLY